MLCICSQTNKNVKSHRFCDSPYLTFSLLFRLTGYNKLSRGAWMMTMMMMVGLISLPMEVMLQASPLPAPPFSNMYFALQTCPSKLPYNFPLSVLLWLCGCTVLALTFPSFPCLALPCPAPHQPCPSPLCAALPCPALRCPALPGLVSNPLLYNQHISACISHHHQLFCMLLGHSTEKRQGTLLYQPFHHFAPLLRG